MASGLPMTLRWSLQQLMLLSDRRWPGGKIVLSVIARGEESRRGRTERRRDLPQVRSGSAQSSDWLVGAPETPEIVGGPPGESGES